MRELKPPFRPDLMSFVNLILDPLAIGAKVFEFNAGPSTLWLAQRADKLVSVEHDEEQWQLVLDALYTYGLAGNVDLILCGRNEIPEQIDGFPDDYFDLILVDCFQYKRVEAVVHSVPKLKDKGLIVIDDAEWKIWDPAHALLSKWDNVTIVGNKSFEGGKYRATSTTIYCKNHRCSL